jgi:hypothetical protein
MVGDGIDLISISGGPRINVVAANDSGVYWFKNPKLTGGNPRTDPWPGSRVGRRQSRALYCYRCFQPRPLRVSGSASEELPARGRITGVSLVRAAARSHNLGFHTLWTQLIGGFIRSIPGALMAALLYCWEQEQTCGTPLIAATHPGYRVVSLCFSSRRILHSIPDL